MMSKMDKNQEEAMATEVSAAEAKARLGECLRLAESGESVLITRYGRAVAALVSTDDLERLERLRSAGPDDGLAGLLGRWEDGQTFADEVLEQSLSHSGPRALPVLD